VLPPQTNTKPMLMDACVLIDFIKADRSVLKIMADNIGPLYVLTTVIEEINEIKNIKELEALGLIVIEPELEDAFHASGSKDSLSFQDKLCLFTAKRYGFICVTNDRELRKQCEKNNVELLWGLQLITRLHRCGGIQIEKSIKIVRDIQRNNPKHINEEIVRRFIRIINDQARVLK
jgi:rRNA-processing protein FCF1